MSVLGVGCVIVDSHIYVRLLSADAPNSIDGLSALTKETTSITMMRWLPELVYILANL